MSGGNWKTYVRSNHNSDGGGELNAETTEIKQSIV